MKKNKTLISVLLCSLLVGSNANASLWDNDSIFNNMTSSSIATDPISGATYISGGALEVRFKKSGSFPPIFSVGAPSLKASCRGISFDAGYAMFMNLERLGQQLSQAGASVAYGILIGLVYSMPGIEQAFTKLNEWSQWLQSFLSDSCSIGTNWGKTMGKDMWKGLESAKNEVTGGIPSPNDYIDKVPNVNNFLKDVFEKGTNDTKDREKSRIVAEIIAKAKGGIISTYLNTLIKRGEEPAVEFPDTTLFSSVVALDDISLRQSSLMMAYFISSITDNIAITESAIKVIAEKIKTQDVDKISEIIDELSNEKTIANIQARNKISPKSMIQFMLKGGKDGSTDIKMAKLNVVLVSLNNKDGIKENLVLLTDQTGTDTNVFQGFEGYIEESKKLAYYTYNQIIKNLYGTDTANPISSSSIKVSAAYPMMFELIRNVVLAGGGKSLLEINSSSDDGPLLHYIAYKNAVALTSIAIDNMQYAITTATSELENIKKDTTVSDANIKINSVFRKEVLIKQYQEQKNELMESMEKMKNELKVFSDEVEKQDNVREINDKLEKIIRERNKRGNN